MLRILSITLFSAICAAAHAQRPVDFERQVLPILEESCVQCHRAPYENSFGLTVQPKAGLRLDGREWILVGGRGGAVVVPGDLDSSSLHMRINLPADDPDRMPNQGDPLTAGQKELLARWISEGSDFGSWEGAAGPGADAVAKAQAEVRAAANGAAPTGLRLFEDLAAGMTPPLAQAVARATRTECQIVPVVPGSPLLRVAFVSNTGSVTDEALDPLKPLAGHVTQLGLGRTGITDQGLGALARMTKLTRLDLHGTAVTDAGLQQLAGLSELRYLNLHSTSVTDKGVQTIGQLRSLTAVYLWNTKISQEGAASLQALLPEAKISYQLDVSPAPQRTGRRRGR